MHVCVCCRCVNLSLWAPLWFGDWMPGYDLCYVLRLLTREQVLCVNRCGVRHWLWLVCWLYEMALSLGDGIWGLVFLF
jgi:hypothetical protein